MKNELNSPAAGYKKKPKTYDHFKYGTQALQENRPHPVESTIDTTAVKRLKTSPTYSGDTNNRSTQRGTGCDQKVSFADSPEVEKLEKMVSLSKQYPADDFPNTQESSRVNVSATDMSISDDIVITEKIAPAITQIWQNKSHPVAEPTLSNGSTKRTLKPLGHKERNQNKVSDQETPNHTMTLQNSCI